VVWITFSTQVSPPNPHDFENCEIKNCKFKTLNLVCVYQPRIQVLDNCQPKAGLGPRPIGLGLTPWAEGWCSGGCAGDKGVDGRGGCYDVGVDK